MSESAAAGNPQGRTPIAAMPLCSGIDGRHKSGWTLQGFPSSQKPGCFKKPGSYGLFSLPIESRENPRPNNSENYFPEPASPVLQTMKVVVSCEEFCDATFAGGMTIGRLRRSRHSRFQRNLPTPFGRKGLRNLLPPATRRRLNHVGHVVVERTSAHRVRLAAKVQPGRLDLHCSCAGLASAVIIAHGGLTPSRSPETPRENSRWKLLRRCVRQRGL